MHGPLNVKNLSNRRNFPCPDSKEINSEVNISHETTTMVVWIYDGI